MASGHRTPLEMGQTGEESGSGSGDSGRQGRENGERLEQVWREGNTGVGKGCSGSGTAHDGGLEHVIDVGTCTWDVAGRVTGQRWLHEDRNSESFKLGYQSHGSEIGGEISLADECYMAIGNSTCGVWKKGADGARGWGRSQGPGVEYDSE